MILYKNPAVAEIAANYNAVYAADTDLSHRVTFKAIDTFMASNDLDPTSCIDIGCGQGQVLTHIAEAISKRGASLASRQLVGVDISEVAIEQSESKRPDLTWAVDSYQRFLTNSTFRSLFPNGVDLIVNEGGFTHVSTEQEYRETTGRTREALSERGYYLFIKNVRFYKKWAHNRASKWVHDPLQIVFDCFGDPFTFPNQGYFVYLFAKDRTRQPRQTFPHYVEFEMRDGSTSTGFVHYDMQTRARVQASVRREHRKLAISDIVLFPTPHVRVPLTAVLQRDKLLPADSLFVKGEWHGSKALLERAHELCTADTEHVVFGGSYADWLVDTDSGQTLVDLDEFESRLNWFLGFLRRHQPTARLHFLTAFPISEGSDSLGNNFVPETAKPFRDVVRALTQRHGVNLVDLTDHIAEQAGKAMLFASKAARSATLELGTQAIVSLTA